MLFKKTAGENKSERKNRGRVVSGGDTLIDATVKMAPAANFRRRSTQAKK
jgi:hypothetical protein